MSDREDRTSFCGECCRVIEIIVGIPFTARHADDRTPLCAPRKAIERNGPEIDVKGFDALLRTRIEASGRDPADNDNWEWHPASDGNKGWRSWKERA